MHGTGTAKKWFPAFCPFNQCIECIIASKKGSAMFLLVLNLSLSSNWAKFAQEFLLWRLVAGNVYILHVYLYLMSAVANRMYVYNKIKTHTLVILMHAKMCIYIYIHMYIILSIIYIVVYIYIDISLYIMSLKFTDPDCWYMLFYPSLYQVSRVGRPLHVERASQINAAPFFSPSGLSPRNMEVLGSWEPWDNTLWNKLWITYECMGVCIYI